MLGTECPPDLRGVVEAVHDGVPTSQCRRHVQHVISQQRRHIRHMLRVSQYVNGAQQDLAGHAGPVRALATQQFSFHEHRVQPRELCGVLSRVLASSS
ncbi:hypothetical protein ACFQ51_44580 [Streptomyces kaempferi]